MKKKGTCFASATDKLVSDELMRGLGTRRVGKRVLSYEELDSTNDVACRLGESGLEEGVCVVAEFQRRGKGRLGRQWLSAKGKNLLISVLLRPDIAPSELSKITLIAAVSVVKAARQFLGVSLGIKWPNDVVYNEHKICGILTEMSAEADRVKFVVIGIGVNLNSDSRELPKGGVSLKKILGRRVNRVAFAQALLRQLEKDYETFAGGHFDKIVKYWEDHSVTSGKRVEARLPHRKVVGQAMGVDGDGALWIRKDSGVQERVLSGDIIHLR